MGPTKYKKILIFGGTGFLGNFLIKLLEKIDAKIILFTRKTNPRNIGKKYKSNPNFKIINWNVTDYELIEENIVNSDCIINLCGILYENKKKYYKKRKNKRN